MIRYPFVLLSIGMTALCWGIYGPLMRWGTDATIDAEGLKSHLLPFIFVGVAYFVIGVVTAGALLWWKGEQGKWTAGGILWSFIAGVVTTLGALGIILALNSGGSPIFVMPLVFGCAPVVNTFVSMYMSKTYKGISPIFLAGLILVITGAVCVLLFNPAAKPPTAPSGTTVATAVSMAKVLMFVAMTALCWGSYGPLLHKGQVLMQGSRLRPFICVGLAYFAIAVVVPLVLHLVSKSHGQLTTESVVWSLAGGTAGALGSLGVILAFTYGGKPVVVMPLVFGLAPVINTLISIATAKGELATPSPFFYAGLIVVVTGAVTVLVFAPKVKPGTPSAVPAKPPVAGAEKK